MNNHYDIIVIGGGHNGLTAATYLARKGKKVLVLEKRAVTGGMAVGVEFGHGLMGHGLLHDTSQVRNWVIRELELEKFGLKTENKKTPVRLFGRGGKTILLTADREWTTKEISVYSEKDAKSYLQYINFINAIRSFLEGLLNEIPPDLDKFGVQDIYTLLVKAVSLKRLGKKTMLELLKVAPMSVRDFLDEYFETDFLKAGLAAPAIHGACTGPYGSYTTLNLLISECCSNLHIPGGPESLIHALEKAALNAGVEIQTGTEATEILMDDENAVRGIRTSGGVEYIASHVASSVSPKTTFLDMLDPVSIPYSLERSIIHYRTRGTTAYLHLALNKPVKWKGLENPQQERIRICESLLEMEKAYDPVKYGKYGNHFVLDLFLPLSSEQQISANGSHVLTIMVHFVPYQLKDSWTDKNKEILQDRIIRQMEDYIPRLKESIIASKFLAPPDLEDIYSLSGGHIFHGEHAVDQLLTRPVPLCARYKTPVKGLYLCGSGSFPGGGLTCAPGALGAKAILKDI